MRKDARTLAFFWECSRRYPRLLIGTFGYNALAIVADSTVPLIIAMGLNHLAYGHHGWHWFIVPGIAVAVLQALGVIGWNRGIKNLWRLEIKVREDLAERTFSHIAHQSEQFHLDNFGGALVADQTKFISAYERLMDEAVFSYFTTLMTVLFIVVALVWTLWWFVLALLIMSALYMVVGVRTRQREIPQSEKAASTHSRQTAQIADTVTNIGTVRSFGHEGHEDDLYEVRTDRYVREERELLALNMAGFFASETVNRITLLVVLGFAVFAVITWDAKVGTILIVVTYTQSLLNRLHQVQRSLKNVVKSLGDARSMMAILDTEPTVTDVRHPRPFRLTHGAVEFRDVHFAYPGRETLFDHFNLMIPPGQRVGLVGASGSGKTTLSKLVLRFIDLDGGQILIDGQDISQVAQSELRQQVTYVPQEPLLFHRTITENIAYGRLGAERTEVIAAAELSRAAEFIDELPEGYETMVGERGTKLSGGQRQRIALARAFLKRTPLLILDEATSALDSHSEALIQAALSDLMEGQTAIVIAHRLSTVAGLDRIVVLDQGRVIEDGAHADLLAADGVYASLWARQSGGFIAGR
ncbi:ABC transporter ATP-binding protein [Conexibacter sp. DBS9H8]|uniref:ABC transporter ATP-binding protein n=1 Tax=Conexibacter sp. DBS9H8 TaxID=2937801 RepID=UPI00200E1B8E|nr:ABC transporter ATP-binding protein [Conexibacter sp. DBS9H8]